MKPGAKRASTASTATAWRRPALFTALSELVTTYGEDATAKYAEGLPARIRNGEFSHPAVAPIVRLFRRRIPLCGVFGVRRNRPHVRPALEQRGPAPYVAGQVATHNESGAAARSRRGQGRGRGRAQVPQRAAHDRHRQGDARASRIRGTAHPAGQDHGRHDRRRGAGRGRRRLLPRLPARARADARPTGSISTSCAPR